MVDPVLPPIVGKAFVAAGKGAWQALQRRRLEAAREIIVRELRRGRAWAIKDDDAAAALFTYLRAAEEGAARLNLEMMAEALANAAQEPSFAPDEFRRHATRLADLSREEVVVLAGFMKVIGDWRVEHDAPEQLHVSWTTIRDHILTTGLFRNRDDIEACCAALTRTGWVAVATGYGGGGYKATPMLDAVSRLVEWRTILTRATRQP